MRTVYFRTNRLDARRFTHADVPAFSAYRADPVVARYQSWSDYDEHRGATLVESMATIELGTPGGSGSSSPSRTGTAACSSATSPAW